MMTTELSAIQRNSIESNRLAAAMAEFMSKGGTVEVLQGFVNRPRPEAKAYGREFREQQEPKPAKRERKRTPTQVRNSSSGRTQVNDALVQRIRELAPTSSKSKVEKETGISRYLLNRLADEHGLQFKQHDPCPNLRPPKVDPVADALHVIRIKELRDKGLARKQAAAAMGVSDTLVNRIIADYGIDFPIRQPGKRR
ncbi:hypothetical protein KDX38_10800 [Pseudomonas sp. CDFA 602]|uniref:hypothetical protein n=1 Tax=Pseudomonas californiensis TaxID=2829823 RepID=UPI001E39C3A8|nr:hypothetical protein [Pseudomonas californiensis]MCD5994195.1 hypothetical protein [Pseudomonas californiensis]MCD5999706.1 hypothetical protein [Pseudomonas californiensis]